MVVDIMTLTIAGCVRWGACGLLSGVQFETAC